MKESVSEKYSKTSFLETALFFSVAFQKQVDNDITIKECIENFKKYLRISDDELPTDCARVKYFRMGLKMRRLIYCNGVTDGLGLNDYKEMIHTAEELLWEIKENIENGKIKKS